MDIDLVDEHARTAGRCLKLLRLLDGMDADDPSAGAVVFEFHTPADLGKQRVVFAEADIQTRTETTTPLADENRPARHEVTVESLDTEALRVAVAAVAG
jgi:hypothetical protein